MRVQHFFVGVLVTVFFPMLPLGVELKYDGAVALASLYIASVMYVAAISLAYENILVFYSGVVAAIWLAVDYGAILSVDAAQDTAGLNLPFWIMMAFGLIQIFKCFDLHITRGENFIYFPRIGQ